MSSSLSWPSRAVRASSRKIRYIWGIVINGNQVRKKSTRWQCDGICKRKQPINRQEIVTLWLKWNKLLHNYWINWEGELGDFIYLVKNFYISTAKKVSVSQPQVSEIPSRPVSQPPLMEFLPSSQNHRRGIGYQCMLTVLTVNAHEKQHWADIHLTQC